MQDVQPIHFVGVQRATRGWVTSYFAVRAQALVEIAIVVVASLLARAAYDGMHSIQSDDFAIGLLAGCVFVLIARRQGLFRLSCLLSFMRHAQRLFASIAASAFAVVVVYFMMKTGSEHSRLVFALFFGLASGSLMLERMAASFLLQRAVSSGAVSGRPVVMIGEREELRNVDTRDLLHFGIEAVARFELTNRYANLIERDRHLVSKAIDFARRAQASEIALMMSWRRESALSEVLTLLRETPLSVRLYPDQRTRDILQKHRGSLLNPYLSIEIQREPLRWSERLAKRSFDIAVALFSLILLSPVLASAALLIKLDSAGPVVFQQRRIGFDKRVFTIFKFRTMTVMEDGGKIRQAEKFDTRITKIGKLLRQTSIDELPQLVNVLFGDMSLVGPRPHALAHDVEFSRKIAEYARRHHVKPGLTGAAQVRGFRGETRTLKQMADRVEWDLWYINNWNFLLDIRIICQTFVSLITHESF